MVVVFALASSLAYGLSDFTGGILTRRTSVWPVAMAGQATSALLTVLVALGFGGDPRGVDFAWAALGGVGSGVGTVFLYRGLGGGRMAVVAPLSAVGAAIVPVLAGLVGGERPVLITWIGLLLALPAIWLVSGGGGLGGGSRADVTNGLLAGAGFGVLFAAIGQVPDGSGLMPLAAAQLVSVAATLMIAIALRAAWVPRDRFAAMAAAAGVLACAATVFFQLATQSGYLTVAGVLSSLYPATTVLLAAVVLHERIHREQGIGLALAVTAVALVAAG